MCIEGMEVTVPLFFRIVIPLCLLKDICLYYQRYNNGLNVTHYFISTTCFGHNQVDITVT
jgi:hypothetical protein